METRCNVTWHVVVSETKVVSEYVQMSLDVPYGKCFNMLCCDTFTRTAGETVHFVRAIALEWTQSAWMKSMIETQVPLEMEKVGQRWVDCVQRWAAGAG